MLDNEVGEMCRATLATRPVLTTAEQIIWDAFGDLSTERVSGMSYGPIPYRAILAYADFNGFSRSETEELIQNISVLDRMLVDDVHKRSSRKTK